MKAPYTLAGGKEIEVNVTSAVAGLLAQIKREDDNEERKFRWRNEASIEAMYDETGWEPTDKTVDIEADYIAKEERNTVQAAIAGLSEKKRLIIRLRYYEGKTEVEIATILGINQSSVHRRLETIHKTLKKYFLNIY